jgi:hypothetical protein
LSGGLNAQRLQTFELGNTSGNNRNAQIENRKSKIGNAVGLTGLEPVTLRLSSACSNQLSYRPVSAAEPPDFRFAIVDFRFGITGAQARIFKI